MSDTADSTTINPQLSEIIDCLYRISAKAVIIEDQKLLLTQELENEWWSLPGGGIDYGETVQQALSRELSEELGVAPSSIQINSTVLFVTIGAIVEHVPRANLFYRVYIPKDAIRQTAHVMGYRWYEADELKDLYLSPSVTEVIDDLANILRANDQAMPGYPA